MPHTPYSRKRRSSGKGVVRQWFRRRRTSRFLKICSQLSFPEIACRTWKNGNLIMAQTAGFRILRVQTERPGLGEGGHCFVAEVLSFGRLECRSFCDSRWPKRLLSCWKTGPVCDGRNCPVVVVRSAVLSRCRQAVAYQGWKAMSPAASVACDLTQA